MIKIELNALISWSLKLVLFIIFILAIYYKQYLFAIYSLVALFVTLLPFIISKNYNITLPWFFDIIIIVPIFLDVFGQATRLYEKIWFYDLITHFLVTAMISIIAFTLVYTLYYIKVIRIRLGWLIFMTIMFSIAMGALWEIFEFIIDTIIGEQVWQDSLQDTMTDMISVVFGGTLAALLGALYFIKASKHKVRHIISPFKTLVGGEKQVVINLSKEEIKKFLKRRKERKLGKVKNAKLIIEK